MPTPETHHITLIHDTHTVLAVTGGGALDADQIAVETDSTFLGYKDDAGNYHLLQNQGGAATFGDIDADDITIATGHVLAITDLTANSILFGGASGVVTQDNAHLSYNPATPALSLDADLILATTHYVGLGAAKGRGVFTDAATDTLQLLDCNIGIGGAPTTKLHVFGEELRLQHNGATLSFYGTAGAGARNGFINFNEADAVYIRNEENTPINIYTNDTLRMTIAAAGGVSFAEAVDLAANKILSVDHIAEKTGSHGVVCDSPLLITSTKQNIRLSQNETDDAVGEVGIISSQYDKSAESEGFLLMGAYYDSTLNDIYIGGYISTLNAATNLYFYTAANNATRTGPVALQIDSSQNIQMATNKVLSVDHIAEKTGSHDIVLDNTMSSLSGSGTIDAATPTVPVTVQIDRVANHTSYLFTAEMTGADIANTCTYIVHFASSSTRCAFVALLNNVYSLGSIALATEDGGAQWKYQSGQDDLKVTFTAADGVAATYKWKMLRLI